MAIWKHSKDEKTVWCGEKFVPITRCDNCMGCYDIEYGEDGIDVCCAGEVEG